MCSVLQYDFFKTKPTEVEVCKLEIEAVKVSGDKVRRGTYANINELKKRCYELESRLECIEKIICSGSVK
jgi:hypothetical protein